MIIKAVEMTQKVKCNIDIFKELRILILSLPLLRSENKSMMLCLPLDKLLMIMSNINLVRRVKTRLTKSILVYIILINYLVIILICYLLKPLNLKLFMLILIGSLLKQVFTLNSLAIL